jgi:hypothetical protein
MHHTLSLLVMLGIVISLHAQYVYTIKADSVKITNCDSAELILENHTQGIPGFLFNTGNGRTQFRHGLVSLGSGSFLVGTDTLKLGTNAWLQGGNSFGTAGVLGTLDNNPLDLYANDTMRIRVTTAGHLLVGTTWDPGPALNLIGDAAVNGNFYAYGNAFFNNGITLNLDGAASHIYSQRQMEYQSDYEGGDQHVFINVVGNAMSGNFVTLNPGPYLFTDSQMVLKVLQENETCALCVAMQGKVGVGQPYPTAQLHVSGTVRFDALSDDSTQTRVVVADANGNLYYRSASSLAVNDFPRSSLAVNGIIRANRLSLQSSGWADCVFDSGYQLPPLSEIKNYIRRERHLPGILSAADVEKNGIDVGVNLETLLRKVEELTLYSIRQDEEIGMLKNEIAELKKNNNH